LKIINIIEKTLSRNDTGETGSHQSGITIPKETIILSFFPQLDKNIKNPRIQINFKDSSGSDWDFSFIYYNNKYFSGTRNEYRLSGTASFIRKNSLKVGDKIIFKKYENDHYSIEYILKKISRGTSDEIIVLSNSWRTISIK
jgi:hypothetical protein